MKKTVCSSDVHSATIEGFPALAQFCESLLDSFFSPSIGVTVKRPDFCKGISQCMQLSICSHRMKQILNVRSFIYGLIYSKRDRMKSIFFWRIFICFWLMSPNWSNLSGVPAEVIQRNAEVLGTEHRMALQYLISVPAIHFAAPPRAACTLSSAFYWLLDFYVLQHQLLAYMS